MKYCIALKRINKLSKYVQQQIYLEVNQDGTGATRLDIIISNW
jgi:hypothetical protein